MLDNRAVENVIHSIDVYYDYSFKIQNDRCYPLLVKINQELEALMPCMDMAQQKELGDILQNLVTAMADHDYVIICDVLRYELRKFMTELLDG